MPIKSSEYINLMLAAHDILPLIHKDVNADFFYKNLDILRKQYKIIANEFDCYTLYPRQKTDKLHEAMELMNEFCAKTDVIPYWAIDKTTILTEKNWETYRHIKQFCNFKFNQIDITKLLDVK